MSVLSETKLDALRYVDALASDYLDDYVVRGGSTVKVLIGDEAARLAAAAAIRTAAMQRKMTHASVNARDTRVQYVQDLFYAIARQLNWNALTSKFLRKLLFPRFDISDDLSIDGIARKNGLDRYLVHHGVDELVQARLLRRIGLSSQFKRAVYNLAYSRLTPFVTTAAATPHVIAWFCGTLDRIVLVKPAMLYKKINRLNGRHMLESLSRWLRDCGVPGLVVCVDISAITSSKKEKVGQHYSRIAAVDCFELIRQFVDSIDMLEGLALIFLADDSFADDERRGISIYPALKMRLSDDVHDALKANPFAPMVRIAG